MKTDSCSPAEAPGRVYSYRAESVGWIVLDNPRKHNAISLAMWRSLVDALASFEEDSTVRCVAICGEGDKSFCAGADVAEKQGVDATQTAEDTRLALASLGTLNAFPKPVLAMISGYCLGAGLAIALACDLRLAGSGASFGIPAAKLGLAYNYSEIKRLTDLIGAARAKQMIFTADRISAERALQIGLVNEVVPANELRAFVTDMANRIAANAPLTITAAKHAIATAVGDPPGRDVAACDVRARACLASEDYAEGRRAFRERRPPVFQGR
jgi:enoyl-CoA hydratase/carnithine racemase